MFSGTSPVAALLPLMKLLECLFRGVRRVKRSSIEMVNTYITGKRVVDRENDVQVGRIQAYSES